MKEIDSKILCHLEIQSPRTLAELKRLSRMIYSPSHVRDSAVEYALGVMPYAPGIYFLLEDNDIHYIGLSRYISSRVEGHRKNSRCPFNRVWWIEVEEESDMDSLEYFYIETFAPPYNRDGGRWALYQAALMAMYPEAAEWHKDAKELPPVIIKPRPLP